MSEKRSSNSSLEGPKIDRRTTLKLLGMTGSVGFAGALAGCTDDDATGEVSGGSDGEGSDGANRGGSIEAGWLTDSIEHLDPHRVDKHDQIQIHSNVFSGLVKLNAKSEIVGDIAKDWTIEDGTRYVFELREGVTFHNGDPVDAEAVKWSLERLMSFDASPHKGKMSDVESVETDGSNTLVIELERPVAPFITFLTRGPGRAGTIVNRTALEEDEDEYNFMPVGSGPFEVTDRTEGQSLTLTAYDDYWETDDDGNPLPYLDEIVIQLIPEPSTMWSALRSDSVQYAMELTGELANQADESGEFAISESNAGEFAVFSLLCVDPAEHEEWAQFASGNDQVTDRWSDRDLPTSDKRVRQAIALALDREELVEKGYFGWAEPAHTVINPSIPWAYEENPDYGQVHDPERARELLDQAGYTGDPRFTVRMLGLPEDERELTTVQEQLRQVGIEAELDIQSDSSYWPATYQYEHEIVSYGGGSDIDPWMTWWKQLGTPNEENSMGAWQRPLYSNPEFDEILEQSYSTPDLEERGEIVREGQKLLNEDVPFVTTVFPFTPKISRTNLKGVETPAGLSNFHYARLTE